MVEGNVVNNKMFPDKNSNISKYGSLLLYYGELVANQLLPAVAASTQPVHSTVHISLV